MTLPDFLAQASRTPFAWGTHDCALFMADWVLIKRRADPAAHLRGRYATELGCARVLRRGGGLEAVIHTCLSGVGIGRTNTPKAEDIGVVLALTDKGQEPVGAICTGPRWAVLGKAGLISAPMPVVAAWRL